MVMAHKLNVSWFDHRTDIPDWIGTSIGQVSIEWAVLERELGELIRLLMDADIQWARIATNRMSARIKLLTAIVRSMPELELDLKKLSRSVLPQSERVTPERLCSILDEIATATQEVRALCTKFESALTPLQHTAPQYSRRKGGYRPKRANAQ
jgi:hypothetical protein